MWRNLDAIVKGIERVGDKIAVHKFGKYPLRSTTL